MWGGESWAEFMLVVRNICIFAGKKIIILFKIEDFMVKICELFSLYSFGGTIPQSDNFVNLAKL